MYYLKHYGNFTRNHVF